MAVSAEDDKEIEATGPMLGVRPTSDKLVRAVARAKVASKLFSKTEQVKLGRYHLLEMVGAGGMGVVWGAWDPELDRRVAIKLVKAAQQSARDRILLEGQALAKLSHPNVVAVYDVGVVEEQVYLVMEWIRGKTLRAYAGEPHGVRDIVTIYRAAAHGLAAAHHAGLVHRDFKPDNAILGDDGRVRVLDFGLARGEIKPPEPGEQGTSQVTRIAGTPRYMAPEQATGQQLTAAVDQFAFCVSLREALAAREGEGAAVVPAWLDAILTRGAAADPAQRFASMDALYAALARDPRTVWRRRMIAGSAVIAIGAAVAVGTARSSGTPIEPCTGGAEEIAAVWSPATGARLGDHLRSLGPYGVAEAIRVPVQLGSYAKKWGDASRDACLAKERRELTPLLFERNVGCLSRTKAAFQTMLQVLNGVTRDELPDAIAAVIQLPDAGGCLLETRTSTVDPPNFAIAGLAAQVSNDIESVRMKALAQTKDAIDAARAVAIRADGLGYKPVIARAYLQHGLALMLRKFEELAVPVLDHATRIGFQANDPVTAIEAFAQQIYAISVLPESKLPAHARDRLGAIDSAESIARGFGPSGEFARILLFNNIGTVRLSSQDPAAARIWFELALRERTRVGVQRLELSMLPGNLARVTEDRASRERLVQQENAELASFVGPHHPSVLNARTTTAFLTENPGEVVTQLGDICRSYQQWHPHLERQITVCAYELAWLAEERGDVIAARSWAAAVTATDGMEVRNTVGLRLFLDGNYPRATAEMVAAADQLLRSGDAWPRWKAVDALLVAALSELKTRRVSQGIALLERANTTLEKLALGNVAFYQRRLARTRRLLATLLVKIDPPRARVLAEAARSWYRSVGGYETALAELDRHM
ncbi:MAG: serine/threonine-protein kinase [Kofleriaceae bacterium]